MSNPENEKPKAVDLTNEALLKRAKDLGVTGSYGTAILESGKEFQSRKDLRYKDVSDTSRYSASSKMGEGKTYKERHDNSYTPLIKQNLVLAVRSEAGEYKIFATGTKEQVFNQINSEGERIRADNEFNAKFFAEDVAAEKEKIEQSKPLVQAEKIADVQNQSPTTETIEPPKLRFGRLINDQALKEFDKKIQDLTNSSGKEVYEIEPKPGMKISGVVAMIDKRMDAVVIDTGNEMVSLHVGKGLGYSSKPLEVGKAIEADVFKAFGTKPFDSWKVELGQSKDIALEAKEKHAKHLEMVTKDGKSINDIPENDRSADICLAAVKQNGRAVIHLTREQKTPEVCAAAMSQVKNVEKYLTDGQIRSGQEFNKLSVKESPNSDVSYKGKHMAPLISSGAPIHNLSNQEFGIYPEDVYSKNASKMYGSFGKNEEAYFRKIQSLKDSPEKMVDIYRAVPNEVFEKVGNTINHGDWVTVDKSYANYHGETRFKGEPFSIQKDTVPAKALYTDGNSIYEYGLDRVAGKIELTAPAQSQHEVPKVQRNVTAQAKPEAKEAAKHEESACPNDASREQAAELAAKLEASRAARMAVEQEQAQSAQQSF